MKKNASLLATATIVCMTSAAVACPDTNGDDEVDVQDLTNVILDWGTDGSGNNGDATGDGIVDVQDLTLVILSWGPFECPADECEVEPGAPANDCCATATEVSGAGQIDVEFDTTNANTDGPDDPTNPCSSGSNDSNIWKDVWFRYTAVEDGLLTVSNCLQAFFDSKIAAYLVPEGLDVCDADTLIANTIGCNEDCAEDGTFFTSELSFDVVAGGQYLVRVGGFSPDATEESAEFGAGVLTFDLVTDNSLCETAAPIAPGDVVDDTTCGSQVSSDATLCPGGIVPTLPGRWYELTGDGTTVTVSTCGTTFDNFQTRMEVYCSGIEGSECSETECIEVTQLVCNVFFESVEFCTVKGNVYYIHVYGEAGLAECGAYNLAVTSDGTPCEDLVACDQPGCADPASNPPFLNSVTVTIPGLADIAQDAAGILYVQGTGDSQEIDQGGCGCIRRFDTSLNQLSDIPAPATTDPAAVLVGLAYDPVNDTIWVQDNSLDAQRLVEITLDGTETGNVIVQPPSPFNTTGLAYDPTGDGGNGSFWYIELTNDDLYEIDRSGNILTQIDQTCLDEGNGLFGNGVTVWTGVLEVLVGEIASGDAERIVPVDKATGETIGEVTGLGAIQDQGETATRGIIRNRLNPNGSMFVTARTTQLIVEIDPPDQD